MLMLDIYHAPHLLGCIGWSLLDHQSPLVPQLSRNLLISRENFAPRQLCSQLAEDLFLLIYILSRSVIQVQSWLGKIFREMRGNILPICGLWTKIFIHFKCILTSFRILPRTRRPKGLTLNYFYFICICW